MTRGRPNGFGARPLGVLALWGALSLALPPRAGAGPGPSLPALREETPDPASTGRPEGPRGPWFSLALLAGTTQFDAGLADYQWDTTFRPGWGIRALAGRGRVAVGGRVWRASSTQSIGDLGAAPDVQATSWELIGEGRVVEAWGTELRLSAAAGRLRLAWDPSRITVQPPGGASAIEVGLGPVGTWIAGAGVAVRRPVAERWTVGLGMDARVFSIDTARRSGDAIVHARERFGDWSTRFELAWWHGRR